MTETKLYMIDPDGQAGSPPIQVYCDMSYDGGGWALVGRGREDWAWNNLGKNVADVNNGIGTSSAFVPAYFPATTVDSMLGDLQVKDLVDGVRIKRAADNSGTTYQDLRWYFSTLTSWSWTFDVNYPLSKIKFDNNEFTNGNTRDYNNDNSWKRVFTWPWSSHANKSGFSYGSSIANGSSGATDFLWESGNENHAIPYSEVYIRPNILSAFSPSAVSGLRMWLDAYDASNFIASNGFVTTWKDKTGRGNDLVFPNDGERGIFANGSGTDKYYDNQSLGDPLATNAFETMTGEYTAFIVMDPTSPGPHTIFGNDCSGPCLTIDGAGNLILDELTGSPVIANTGKFKIYTVTNRNSGTLREVHVNGTSKLAETSSSYTGTSWQEDWFNAGGTQKTAAKFKEVLFFNRALSETERKSVEGYLGSKWSILYVTDNLRLHLDAAYAENGTKFPTNCAITSWKDVGPHNISSPLTNFPNPTCTSSSGWNGTGSSPNAYTLTFDGSNDHIDLGTPSQLELTGNQTIEFWIKPHTFNARRNPYNRAFGGTGTITQETDGRLNYFWGTHGGNSSPYQGVNSGTALTLNNWHHLVLVRDLTGTMTVKWYINGMQTASTSASYSAATAGNASYPHYIGTGYTSYYDGEIAVFRIYGKALSAEEVDINCTAEASRFGVTCQ